MGGEVGGGLVAGGRVAGGLVAGGLVGRGAGAIGVGTGVEPEPPGSCRPTAAAGWVRSWWPHPPVGHRVSAARSSRWGRTRARNGSDRWP